VAPLGDLKRILTLTGACPIGSEGVWHSGLL
jgi:hypothetical protein